MSKWEKTKDGKAMVRCVGEVYAMYATSDTDPNKFTVSATGHANECGVDILVALPGNCSTVKSAQDKAVRLAKTLQAAVAIIKTLSTPVDDLGSTGQPKLSPWRQITLEELGGLDA